MTKVKIAKSFSRKYGPVMLWLDDAQEIFDRVKGTAESVEVANDDYTFATLESAKEYLGEAPRYVFKISSSRPYMSLDGDRTGTSLYVSSGEKSAQLFIEIDEILTRCQRKPRWAYSSWIMLPVFILGAAQYAVPNDELRLGLLSVQFLLFAWYMRAAFIGMRRGMVVRMQRRSEAKGFLDRNRDQLILFVITAIVSGLLGFAGGQIKDRFFPSTNSQSKAAP